MVEFQCTVPAGQIPQAIRGTLVQAIEQACGEALGPDLLVTVDWIDIPKGFGFRGGEPSKTSLVRGKIPDGYDSEVRTRLLKEIGDAWCRISGGRQDELVVSARDRSWTGAGVAL